MEQVSVVYDDAYDILYLDIGDPIASDTERIAEDIYLRVDMETESICTGAMIMEYSKKEKAWVASVLPSIFSDYLPDM